MLRAWIETLPKWRNCSQHGRRWKCKIGLDHFIFMCGVEDLEVRTPNLIDFKLLSSSFAWFGTTRNCYHQNNTLRKGEIMTWWCFGSELDSLPVEVNKRFLFPFHYFRFPNNFCLTGMNSPGEKWKSRRKMLTPAFHFRILDEFIDVIKEQSLKMVNILKTKFFPGHVFDVSQYVKRCTLDIICGSNNNFLNVIFIP